jgi:hypothetical protein
MEPTAIESAVVDRDAAGRSHPEGSRDASIAAEQPEIPSRGLGFHHCTEIAVKRLKILIGSDS